MPRAKDDNVVIDGEDGVDGFILLQLDQLRICFFEGPVALNLSFDAVSKKDQVGDGGMFCHQSRQCGKLNLLFGERRTITTDQLEGELAQFFPLRLGFLAITLVSCLATNLEVGRDSSIKNVHGGECRRELPVEILHGEEKIRSRMGRVGRHRQLFNIGSGQFIEKDCRVDGNL